MLNYSVSFSAWFGLIAAILMVAYLVVTNPWVSDKLWKALAWVIIKTGYAERLVEEAMCGDLPEYVHLTGYMERWWLFNPTERKTKTRKWDWIPFAIRVHWIKRADLDPHKHNHPWDARTIILKGWYQEEREEGTYLRKTGYTGPILADDFHRIIKVAPGGVWTMFIMFRFTGMWGFRTEDGFVPYAQYLNKREEG